MSTTRTALITGVSGQDGMFLARLLLSRDWKVVGTIRPGISSIARMAPYLEGVKLVEHDITDSLGFADLLSWHAPEAVFNLAAFSSVGRSWSDPELVMRTNGMAVVQMLDSILRYRDKNAREIRFFQASTAEIFGSDVAGHLDEDTAHRPRTPYAIAKSAAHDAVISYREHYGMHASNGILFNHESPFRGQQFVAGKIARAAAEAATGNKDACVTLGDIDIERDWGSARDYVQCMAAAVEHAQGGDYVVATGTSHTLRDMLVAAFAAAGLDDPMKHVRLDPGMWSSTQADSLTGDPTRAGAELNWKASATFEEVISEMVAVDMRRITTGVDESTDYLP
jgi:GDPmannose 4,6-dehydratase